MDSSLRDQLAAHLERYNKWRKDKNKELKGEDGNKIVSYGTAGFRGRADQIEHLFYNVGLISALRCLQSKATIGIMITASHNPIQDNGVKLIDSNGEMLNSQWEPIVEQFCNTRSTGNILNQLETLVDKYNIDTSGGDDNQVIIIGMDTRPSSEALMALVKQGIQAWSPLVQLINYGHVTTPALHYLVAESNSKQMKNVELPLQCYYDQLIKGLVDIFSRPTTTPGHHLKNYFSNQLIVDCANGVGYETMQNLCNNPAFVKYLPVKLINSGEGVLNKLCGADYVKTIQMPPSGANDTSKRYAAIDGDADRVVYFYLEGEGGDMKELKLKLLDGDKIMALYALYLKDALKKANLDRELTLGLVQTAYANGASTDYMLNELDLNVDCVDTGVKNLHKRALNYDLGIYFEANGHGTIWVSKKAQSIIEKTEVESVLELKRLFAIINNYTGDAISDILVVETILRHYDWDIKQWYNLYQDRPNSLIKVEVQDRNLIKTANAGRTCIEPETLQPAIDSIVDEFGYGARCFVRPSGTENVVRIYAEAKDQQSAEKLSATVGDKNIEIKKQSPVNKCQSLIPRRPKVHARWKRLFFACN